MHASTDRTTATRVLRKPTAPPWMAAWTGESPIEGRLICRPRPEAGLMYTDEHAVDRGPHDALLVRGRRPAPKGNRGKPLYAVVNYAKQRRAMRRLLCHLCGNPAHRDELGVLWLLNNVAANCEPGWPEGEVTVHPPVCLGCAGRAVEECPELHKFTALWVSDPEEYGYYGTLYTRDLSALGSPFPAFVRDRETLAFDDPLLPWLHCAQSAMALNDVTVVNLDDLVPAA
jgi:hypothetical protein